MPPRISSNPSCHSLKSIKHSSSVPKCRIQAQQSHFSTSPSTLYPRKQKQARGNLLRGMSAIKGTGVAPWFKLSVTHADLKQPRNIEHKYDEREDHGLWQFFNDKRQLLTDPFDESKHGRAWTVEELRRRSWEDLHSLWWSCLKERNRIETELWTRRSLKAGFGEDEAKERGKQVNYTMKSIKNVLTERQYAWEDAQKLSTVQSLPTTQPNHISQAQS